MNEHYKRKILENEELQEIVQESAHFFEEHFDQRAYHQREERGLLEDLFPDLEDSDDVSPLLSIRQDLEREEAQSRYAYEDTFDTLSKERRRLEDENDEIYQQMYADMKKEEENERLHRTKTQGE